MNDDILKYFACICLIIDSLSIINNSLVLEKDSYQNQLKSTLVILSIEKNKNDEMGSVLKEKQLIKIFNHNLKLELQNFFNHWKQMISLLNSNNKILWNLLKFRLKTENKAINFYFNSILIISIMF